MSNWSRLTNVCGVLNTESLLPFSLLGFLDFLKLLQLSLLTLEIVNTCTCYLLLVDLTLNRESIKDRKEHSLRNMFHHTDMSLPSVSMLKNQKRLQSWIKHISGHCSLVRELLKSRHSNCQVWKLSNDSKYEIFKQFRISNQTISNMKLSNNLKYQIFKRFQILILLIVRVEVNQ